MQRLLKEIEKTRSDFKNVEKELQSEKFLRQKELLEKENDILAAKRDFSEQLKEIRH